MFDHQGHFAVFDAGSDDTGSQERHAWLLCTVIYSRWVRLPSQQLLLGSADTWNICWIEDGMRASAGGDDIRWRGAVLRVVVLSRMLIIVRKMQNNYSQF